MTPNLSYTIWFTQRTGSTLLEKAIESTGMAGVSREWFNCPPDLLTTFKKTSHAELQEYLYKLGSTPNGIFGISHSFYEPHFSQLTETLRNFPAAGSAPLERTALWERIFPNHRHIFMTRRNKVRLAVSWWRAIQSNEWHVSTDQTRDAVDISDKYSFEAINHLYNECSMREAGIQEFLAEGGITPLNIFYEDFVQNYTGTVRTILDYLDLDSKSASIAPPALTQLADSVSEEWVQRFRQERQNGWTNLGW